MFRIARFIMISYVVSRSENAHTNTNRLRRSVCAALGLCAAFGQRAVLDSNATITQNSGKNHISRQLSGQDNPLGVQI